MNTSLVHSEMRFGFSWWFRLATLLGSPILTIYAVVVWRSNKLSHNISSMCLQAEGNKNQKYFGGFCDLWSYLSCKKAFFNVRNRKWALFHFNFLKRRFLAQSDCHCSRTEQNSIMSFTFKLSSTYPWLMIFHIQYSSFKSAACLLSS